MKLEYNKPIRDVIELRHSVRNYIENPIPEDILKEIESYIASSDNPFEKDVRIKLIKKDTENRDLKLGTYGVIRGANYFLVTACDKDKDSYLSLGYTLEKVILKCTSLGLGTVWLGGTFQKGEFAKAISLEENEALPIVAPVGYEGGKKTLLGTLFGNHNKQRKSFTDIFFEESFDKPLQPAKSGLYKEALEMLRLAPSAVNKQPWRAVKDGDDIHFYLTKTRSLNYIDLGIALCHFHLTVIEQEINGRFTALTDKKQELDHDDYDYQISWIKEK